METASGHPVGRGIPYGAYDDLDDGDRRQATRRPPSIAAGMAFCIPALSVLSLLYTLLK